MMVYLLAGALALGAYGGWRITTWAYDADYKAQVEEVSKEYESKRIASEKIIRESLQKEQKTRIVYRTIKEKAHEVDTNTCLDANGVRIWNEASTKANNTEAGKPVAGVREATDIVRRELAIRAN
ncbi:MAG: hypothetical protein ACE5DN_03720 [Flavobacteriales bacterium]